MMKYMYPPTYHKSLSFKYTIIYEIRHRQTLVSAPLCVVVYNIISVLPCPGNRNYFVVSRSQGKSQRLYPNPRKPTCGGLPVRRIRITHKTLNELTNDLDRESVDVGTHDVLNST